MPIGEVSGSDDLSGGLRSLSIPGVLTRACPIGPASPVVVDSPHSGSLYPNDLVCSVPRMSLRRAEDMYVEELFANAPKFGAIFIQAHFPRSYIDPNRALDDLDPALLSSDWPDPVKIGEKAQLGHGLIWRFCPPDLLMYRDPLPSSQVHRRINKYWRPYHDCLRTSIEYIHQRFGEVWHLNCHSMPSSRRPGVLHRGGCAQADFVLGDRDGTSCGQEFRVIVADTLQSLGYSVAINDPYKGVELVRAYSNPAAARHSLQIEINRSLYMNERTLQKISYFEALKADLDKLIAAIADFATTRLVAAAE
ncbi:MAG: N-formylglutamate amidohydrolase [Rhodospirillaceae bacterium]|nr:N-formylglutamate amidohydrolase [Rhodospirillaceae bacterium]